MVVLFGALVQAMVVLFDVLVFSSLWVGCVAAALSAAASLAMGVPAAPAVIAIASGGAIAVYNVDRLRDLERDQLTSPQRSAFVAAHRTALRCLTAVAGGASFALAAALGTRVVLLLAPVLAVGLLHRRLKQIPYGKALYIASAWLVVTVGLPAVSDSRVEQVPGVAAVIGFALLANLLASSIRDEVRAAPAAARALGLARASAALGTAVAMLGPSALAPLVGIPAAIFAVLLPFRSTERYGMIAVDGALLLGALAAIALSLLAIAE